MATDTDNDKDTNDFTVLRFLTQQFVRIVTTSGICARIKHGTLTLELRISDDKITFSEPSIKFGIK
jgi:hypothetical protein